MSIYIGFNTSLNGLQLEKTKIHRFWKTVKEKYTQQVPHTQNTACSFYLHNKVRKTQILCVYFIPLTLKAAY